MSERRPPRFPYVAALLCAACVAVASWVWTKYSCCHEMAIGDAYDFPMRDLEGEYVRLKGCLGVTSLTLWTGRHIRRQWFVYDPINLDKRVFIYQRDRDAAPHGVTDGFTGRIVFLDSYLEPVLDTTTGRLTGASIAGLVVGAMGVFVFTVALRYWLGERRRFREDAGGSNNGVERAQDA